MFATLPRVDHWLVFFFFWGACCGFSLGGGRDGFGAALAGIAFCGSFACCVGADDGVAYEDDDAVSAGAPLGGGGFGPIDGLLSMPCCSGLRSFGCSLGALIVPDAFEDSLGYFWIEVWGDGLFPPQPPTLCFLFSI